MKFLDRLLGRKPRSPEVQDAIDQRDQDFRDLGDAIAEVDQLRNGDDRKKNGVIADYIEAEKNRPRRRPR